MGWDGQKIQGQEPSHQWADQVAVVIPVEEVADLVVPVEVVGQGFLLLDAVELTMSAIEGPHLMPKNSVIDGLGFAKKIGLNNFVLSERVDVVMV